MSDDDSGASELERAVLGSDRALQPPAGADAAVWGRLSAELGLPALSAVPSTASSSAAGNAAAGSPALAPTATGSLAFAKGIVVGVLASGALWQGHDWLSEPKPGQTPGMQRPSSTTAAAPAIHRSEPTPSAKASEPESEPRTSHASNENRPASRRADPTASLEPSSAPSAAAFGEEDSTPLSPAQRASQLREEAELLRRARAQLRANDLAGAFALLETSRRRFSTAELYQEREALSIELLYRTGQAVAARARAERFLASFPESPHAGRLKTFISPAVRR